MILAGGNYYTVGNAGNGKHPELSQLSDNTACR